MEIEQYLYDLNDSGDAIVAYTMRSNSGGSVQICNLGASLLALTLPDGSGELREVASGSCVKGLAGLLDDRERFAERLWESRVEVNRVVMSLSYECDGVGITAEVIFDYDDEDCFEITYQAVVDSNSPFDLMHNLKFNLSDTYSCEVKSSTNNDNIYNIDGAEAGILKDVAELHCVNTAQRIAILSSQPSLYYNAVDCSVAPITAPVKVLKEGERFIQKSVYKPLVD
ncbi:MAG: hypothetical protein SNF68_00295 [Rikenellaceae bacterium]